MDFLLDAPELRRDAIQEISLRNKEGFEAYKKLRFIFVQMPLFTKNLDELASRRDEWLYALRELPKLEQMPAPLKQEPIFRKFFDLAAEANMTSAEYAVYEDELNERRLENGVHNAMVTDARNEGLAEGEAKGRAEGVIEGKREMARALKANGMSIADIARLSGLSQNEVADSLKKK
jgi:predicted transposase/invertase (TIGR01784 family)